ncbi:GGDEF domain-containing protein [Noviherbaspirillum autotrophicum]|uniref:diguanylate cyclase n=1 Tax=Noviherbaspirillum autotrophicum TaxID=709839 RepID=A0A0C1YNE6_9BURK|nr:GGDEF domain-containing protein [Noviherbaspirillum autotrophicum]KIF82102.1 diguanylate cyclase [Noviherbaspirillum autotrophicum]
MNPLADQLWHRLTGIMPGELKQAELGWLATPLRHQMLLARRRATLIVNRVRLFAFLFALLTPMWSIVDFVVFPFPLWINLALMRFAACAAFASLLVYYRPSGNLFDAYRAMAILFAIPSVFYVASRSLLGSYHLTGLSAAIGAGYAFLPFVLLAGLSIFPLTLLESAVVASPILLAQLLAGYINWAALDWPSFAGAFWLLMLITAVSALAGMSQLAFMIALVRQAIRDPLTGTFSRRSGEELIDLQFTIAKRNNLPLAIAFLDIDHFKDINDSFGHEAGDKVLADVTAFVGKNLRRGDTLVRWGGEEFLLVMTNTDRSQAEAAVARLRAAGFGTRPDKMPLTASIGIAERSVDQAADWKSLVDLADQRMYRAKQGGRDRVVSCDAPAVP